MTILDAARRAYAQFPDTRVFPVVWKTPLVKTWRDLPAGVHGTADEWAKATGYAIAPCKGSNLVCIDVDDPAVLPQIYKAIPALQGSYTVRRGDHVHIYARLAYTPGRAVLKLRRNGREAASLRSYGAYWIGLDSHHESGDTYVAQ